MQVKEENGNYICLKHNQTIIIVVMDNRVLPENQMLCNICMSENRLPLNQVLSVQQAKEMLNEKLNKQTAGEEERINEQLEKLRLLQQNMIELRSQLLKNIDMINRMIDQWTIELSNSINKESIDLIKGLQLLQSNEGDIKQNNINYMNKIDSAFKSLLNIDGINQCYQQFKNIGINDEELKNKIQHLNYLQQKIKKEFCLIGQQLICQVMQLKICKAIAFNNTGSIMVAGSNKNIKVYQFEKGKITQLTELQGQGDMISCLLNNDENQLISSSRDLEIIIWSVEYETNRIDYQYILERKHTGDVLGISLNQSETSLVSCGEDKQLILWIKGQNGRWIYQNSITLSNYLLSVCFIGQTQLLVQQEGKGFINVFEVVNQYLKEQNDHQITLKDPKEDCDYGFFPIIYNRSKEIIILKSHQYVYIIRKQSNGSLKVESQPIDCQIKDNQVSFNEHGQYIVIWNGKTKEFKVQKISYE